MKKPKVNFVDASSCDCGMEISAAVSRLFLSFSSNHLRVIERANEPAPHPDPAGFLGLNSTIEKVGTRARPGANERTASAADPRKMIPCAHRRGEGRWRCDVKPPLIRMAPVARSVSVSGGGIIRRRSRERSEWLIRFHHLAKVTQIVFAPSLAHSEHPLLPSSSLSPPPPLASESH